MLCLVEHDVARGGSAAENIPLGRWICHWLALPSAALDLDPEWHQITSSLVPCSSTDFATRIFY